MLLNIFQTALFTIVIIAFALFRDSITLLWTASRTMLNPEWLSEGQTIADLWRRASNNNLLVPATYVKRKVMDLHIVVQEEEDPNVGDFEDGPDHKNKVCKSQVFHNQSAISDLISDLHYSEVEARQQRRDW